MYAPGFCWVAGTYPLLVNEGGMANNLSQEISPWAENYRLAVILFLICASIIYATYKAYVPLSALLVSFVAFMFGVLQLKQAVKRKFGKDLEGGAINSASPLLLKQGFRVKSSVLVPGLGDVDMIVTNHSNKKVTVEIKSFIRWNQFGPFKGQRESKAIVQAERQKEAVNADAALIWLPQGRRSLVQILLNWVGSSHVDVVFGDASKLARVLKRI
jgi:hypothetical protein